MTGRRMLWRIVCAIAACLYALGVILLAIDAASQGPRQLATPLAWFVQPRNGFTLFILLGLLVIILSSLAAIRREAQSKQRTDIVAVVILASSTLVLAYTAYWHCVGVYTPGWSPLAWALDLFDGYFENPFGARVAGCSANIPIGLEYARITAHLTVIAAVFSVLVRVFADRIDYFRLRHTTNLVAICGQDDFAVDLVAREAAILRDGLTLGARGARGRNRVVLLATGLEDTLVRRCRSSGAIAAFVDWDRPETVRRILAPRHRLKTTRILFVDAEPNRNLNRFDLVESLGEDQVAAAQPRQALIRIDDPWQAEYWRRVQVDAHLSSGRTAVGSWWIDTLSVIETTAIRVLDAAAAKTPVDRPILLVGFDELSLAMCTEMAKREREALAVPDGSVVLRTVQLAGADSGLLFQQHLARESGFGAGAGQIVTVAESLDDRGGWIQNAAQMGSATIIVTDDSLALVEAEALTTEHTDWVLFRFDMAVEGVPHRPILEGLYGFGFVYDAAMVQQTEILYRVARAAHRRYLLELGASRDPSRESHKPWEELEPFWKESNIRQVRSTLANVARHGWTWTSRADSARQEDQILDDLEELAREEHEDWCRFMKLYGWRHARIRCDVRKEHDCLVPYDELSECNRKKDRDGFLTCFALLGELGYHPHRAKMIDGQLPDRS